MKRHFRLGITVLTALVVVIVSMLVVSGMASASPKISNFTLAVSFAGAKGEALNPGVGPKGVSVGDEAYSELGVTRAGKPYGTVSGVAQVLGQSGSFGLPKGVHESMVTLVYDLPTGQIFVLVADKYNTKDAPMTSTGLGAIIGGTGAFAGARGTMLSHESATADTMTFRFI